MLAPPQFDFVDALSAEERCPVCEELHAAVDQHACARCGTTVCHDCASLSPDTSWICSPCVSLEPPRVFAPREPSTWRALLARRAQLTTRGSALLSAARPGIAAVPGTLARAASGLLRGAVALFVFAWRVSLRVAGRTPAPLVGALAAQRRLTRRAESRLRAHAMRVSHSFRTDRLIAQRAIERLLDDAAMRTRWHVSRFVLSIRNVSVREQLTGLLIGTVIFIAVARSHRHHSR